MDEVEVFIDGACLGNPGIGGWSVVFVKNGEIIEFASGAEISTTNNRMELKAALRALEFSKGYKKLYIYTDSIYLQKGITEWSRKWIQRKWRTSDNKPVKNQDLWKKVLEEIKGREIEWCWIKGHSGIRGNERADKEARLAAKRLIDG